MGPSQPIVTAAANARTLRRLFLMLFLRGRSARGLQQQRLPLSVPMRLGMVLVFYALFGLIAFALRSQPILALAVYLHVTTFMLLGLFVASSAGEVLFNKDEADILLHRPIRPRELLWAKVSVLVQVSLWLAGAFNLAGLYAGWTSAAGDWRFPPVHVLSTLLEALFCVSCVVLTYQLCLRWFGRERLEGLMTAAQVLVSVGLVLSGQLMPRLFRLGLFVGFNARTWWIILLPPAWFAGLDDALAGAGGSLSWILAALALGGTAGVLWSAFGRLARDYTLGLQSLSEVVGAPPPQRSLRRRWSEWVNSPPLAWIMRDPAERAAFSLSVAYLLRDREVKLRVYPAIASMLAVPLFSMFTGRGQVGSAFLIAFGGSLLGLAPLTAIRLLQYSQQWQAADLFRMVPVTGPAPLCRGATLAVLCVVTLPFFLLLAIFALSAGGHPPRWWLLLPGLIALPVYAMIPGSDGDAVPLSRAGEEAKSASRGLVMIGAALVAMVIAGLATWSRQRGWFWPFVGVEAALAAFLYHGMRRSMLRLTWNSIESG
jgi:ABC-2 type transport system permease protein